jgi:protein SSD1
MKRGDWTNKTSHYRSLDLGGQRTNSKPYVPPVNAPNRSSTHRSPLHTVNEEENIMQYNRNRYSRYQDDEPAQRASIDSATSFYQRKQRSSVAHFNNFPLAAKTANSVLDNDDELANKLSREYVLAQTEAKLTGHSAANHHQTRQQNVYHTTGNNLDETRFLDQYRRSQTQEKQNRRLSEPNPRMYYQQYPQQFQQQQHDSSDDISRGGRHSNVLNKRMSFQYNLSDAAADTNRSKPHQKATLSLDLSAHQKANTGRATSMDWRAPKSPTTPTRPQSARLSTSSLREEMMSNGGGNQRKPLFTSHLPFSSVVPYLKSNQLVSGLLRVNKRNRSDAYVFCEEHNADIYICGSRDRNRALEGDHVAIKLIEVEQVMLEKHEKEEAKLARNNGQPVIRKPDEEDEKEIIFGGEEDVDLVTPRFCGMVVAILDRAQKQVFSG